LDAGHVDHAYAGTVYKAQGSTVETAHTLGTGLFREDGHVALSRGRATNQLYLVQGEPEAEIDLPTSRDRDALRQALDTLGQSREKRLATDTAVWGAGADQLRLSLTDAARLLRDRPVDDTTRLPALHNQVDRLGAQVADARTRLDTLQAEAASSPSGLRARLTGRRAESESLAHRIGRQTDVCHRLEQQLTALRDDVAAVERGDTTRARWADQHAPELRVAAAAGRELSWRTRAQHLARTITGPNPQRIREALTPTRTKPAGQPERQRRHGVVDQDADRYPPREQRGPGRGR
jgi:chromosome segregation ATPase